MSTESLDEHLRVVGDLVARQKAVIEENALLRLENERLTTDLASHQGVFTRNVALERRLEDARQTRKTLQKIEGLEAEVCSLQQTILDREGDVAVLELQRTKDSESLAVAEMFVDRLVNLSQKLRIKTGSRNPKELLSAIEDAVRKLV